MSDRVHDPDLTDPPLPAMSVARARIEAAQAQVDAMTPEQLRHEVEVIRPALAALAPQVDEPALRSAARGLWQRYDRIVGFIARVLAPIAPRQRLRAPRRRRATRRSSRAPPAEGGLDGPEHVPKRRTARVSLPAPPLPALAKRV